MGQKFLGLDIGSYSIKGTLIERNWRDFVVLDYFERLNDADAALTPLQQLNYHLQKFFEDHPLPADTAVMVALPGQWVQYRIVLLPLTSSKKIDQAMEFELENHIPLDLEKVWFDYQVLKTDKNGSELLCAYTQLDDFKMLLNSCLQNQLDPRQIGADAADLAALAYVAMLPQEGHYALIDFGHQKTSIVILDGSRVRYIRTLAVGSAEITRKLAERLQLSAADAERLKCDKIKLHSSLEADGSPMLEAAGAVIKQWIIDIRQTFAAYAQGGRDQQVQAIYLFGGGSRLIGLPKVLASALKMNVTTLDSLAMTPHRLADPQAVMLSCPQSFATALKALSWPKQLQINFRKGDFAYRGDIEGLQVGLKKAAMWIAAILGAAVLHYQVSHYILSAKVDSVRKEAKAVLGQDFAYIAKNKGFTLTNALALVTGKTAELEQKLALLSGGQASTPPLSVLKELSLRLPDKEQFQIDVDFLNVTEKLVRFEGKTTSFEAVDAIEQGLGKSPYFFNVKRDNAGKGLKDDIKFTFSFSLENRE